MPRKQTPGLFVSGTDTEVGKTYVGCLLARALRSKGYRVGVYKPAASGCRREHGTLVSDDAIALWEAAGRPGTLEQVCPQRFERPLAPHLAAREEGRRLDPVLLRTGLEAWLDACDVVLVEGAGGLMSPLGEEQYVADLAYDFGFPLVIVSRNALGTINHTLQTLITAATFRGGLAVAGIVLNHPRPVANDPSVVTNPRELAARCTPGILAAVAWQGGFDREVPWYELARGTRPVL